METVPTGFDPNALARLAYKRIGRRGLRDGLEAEELVAVGRAAIIASGARDAPLAVKVARNAMFDAIRKEVVRWRGRATVRAGHAFSCDGEEPSAGDMWDSTVHHGQHLQPAAEHYDLWEAMRALPEREYRVVSLHFWGGITMAAIGVELGVSERHAGRILESAKKNLKAVCQKRTPQTLTNVRGEETRRAVLSGRTEDAQ